MNEPVAAISFDSVSFRYPEISVLENATFEIAPRDFVSIIGPNGGGKTTLARLILGLVEPASGTIRVFGKSPQAARHKIGYVPQYTSFDLSFPVTIRDVVLMGRVRNRPGLHRRADFEAAEQALSEVGMVDLRNRPFSELSGGQRQRVLIARALSAGPEILLLDEPTANVDVAVENQVNGLLRRLNETLTVLLITHDLGFVSELVNRLVCVNHYVKVHPTTEVTPEMIKELYGGHVLRVEHGKGDPRTIDVRSVPSPSTK